MEIPVGKLVGAVFSASWTTCYITSCFERSEKKELKTTVYPFFFQNVFFSYEHFRLLKVHVKIFHYYKISWKNYWHFYFWNSRAKLLWILNVNRIQITLLRTHKRLQIKLILLVWRVLGAFTFWILKFDDIRLT